VSGKDSRVAGYAWGEFRLRKVGMPGLQSPDGCVKGRKKEGRGEEGGKQEPRHWERESAKQPMQQTSRGDRKESLERKEGPLTLPGKR